MRRAHGGLIIWLRDTTIYYEFASVSDRKEIQANIESMLSDECSWLQGLDCRVRSSRVI